MRKLLTLALAFGLAVGLGVPATAVSAAAPGQATVVVQNGGNEWG